MAAITFDFTGLKRIRHTSGRLFPLVARYEDGTVCLWKRNGDLTSVRVYPKGGKPVSGLAGLEPYGNERDGALPNLRLTLAESY